MRPLGDILSVTVVGAEYPVNLGYTARLMKNFGVERLYLVGARCDMRAASVYASHGSDILEGAEVVTLEKVRRIHDLLLATTAIRASVAPRRPRGPAGRAPISLSISEKRDGTINPSSRKVNRMGSKMKTMSQEYHFSENGQKGRTP